MSQQVESQTNSINITDKMLDSLGQTKPWARFSSIIGFISIGIMIIAGIRNMVVFSKANAEGVFFLGILSYVMNIILGLLYFFPSLFLFKYASSIGRLQNGGGVIELEEALSKQKTFWKFIGIIVIVTFCFGILAGIVVPHFERHELLIFQK